MAKSGKLSIDEVGELDTYKVECYFAKTEILHLNAVFYLKGEDKAASLKCIFVQTLWWSQTFKSTSIALS